MKLRIEKSITVITPTIGKDTLGTAIESVINQKYGNITHLVVVDGSQFVEPVNRQITDNMRDSGKLVVTTLPFNTGGGGFYGHRIYAGFSHLINSDYIAFLDEDNWYEPNHISSLIDTLEFNQTASFAYSLRNIYDQDQNFICNDNCESLGKWPIWFTGTPDKPASYLIDTSSFLFHRHILELSGHHWHSGWGGDRRFLYTVMDMTDPIHNNNFVCSGEYTLNYRLDGNPNSVTRDFFINGNKQQYDKYKGIYPWMKILQTN